jgi:ATP-binding cassette, subfamily B, bacterial MsbA
MNPSVISADKKNRAPDQAFRAREFGRVVALTRNHRRGLIFGLIITVGFAGLHTISIAGTFPIFQVLLEKEGLHGWIDRAVVENRLGLTIAPLSDDDVARIIKVEEGGVAAEAGIGAGDEIHSPTELAIRPFFDSLANTEDGGEILIVAGPPGTLREIPLHPNAPEVQTKLLQWVATYLPPDGPDSKLKTLGGILIAVVCIVIFANILRFAGELLVATAVLRSMMDLRDRLYERILHLPMSYFSGGETSDLVTRFVQDVQEIQRGLVTLFGKAIREPMRAMFLIALALAFDWRVTMTIVVVVPFTVVIFLAVGRKAKKANRRLLVAYGNMIGALTTSLQNLRVVKAYTAESHEQKCLDTVDKRMLAQQIKLARLDAFLSPMMETLAVLAGSLLTVWLASRVLDQTLSLSKFAGLGVALSMLFDPLRKLTDVYVRIQRSTAGAERIFSILDHPPETSDCTDAKNIELLQRTIDIDDVSFTYPGASKPALDGVSLTIEKGETIAIVGPNGCGKTTLVSMLPRLFDPDSGKIRFDDRCTKKATLLSLRRQIGLVSQDAVVFAGTPIENITYGTHEVDRSRAEKAAIQAYADEFIRELPGEYEAALGERGTTLSGGQRQRLAIARAIYRDAPILIFDEATSQIDAESEQKIQTALREFSKERTTIIIAHRLSTIQFADRIVVMDAGKVVDAGTHKQLYERCQLYKTLCDTQFVAETVA